MTRISQSSEYAIRALTYLATRDDEGYHLVRVMAAEIGVPGPFLAKLLKPLVERGILDSQRGRGGGFRLARDPGDVTLFDIVDSQDNLRARRTCMLGQAECSDERACPLHEFWKAASEEFLAEMRRTSLRDLAAFCHLRPAGGYPFREAG